MNIFSERRRVNAVLAKWTGKLVKAKGASAQDGAKIKACELKFHAPITNELRDALPPKLASLITIDGGGEDGLDCVFNATDVKTAPTPVIFQIFNFQNFTPKGRPLVSIGGADDGVSASADVTRIFTADGATMLEINVRCQKTDDLWQWLGDNFGETETTIELLQLQGELDLDADEDDEQEVGGTIETVNETTGEVDERPAKRGRGAKGA